MAKNTDNAENVEVVVCKGHTVYHNGEKYGENRKLKLSQADTQTLQARGFVVPLADVLAIYEEKQEAAEDGAGNGDAG
ncbi:hypothetical protein AXA88_24560 [Salmonella enterica]|nr:hypothetical protein [Salmonella enterica]EEN5590598.1 hypothetical protein [Salmonella enterica subsp. enterica serovar Mountpleasant]EAX3609034.1 hypothetical protein [Salmonella enterica]EEL2518429.1 hypothetical protein [Salmonella enterica]EGW6282572.1 hypothetical protein [Salmonella enterica]